MSNKNLNNLPDSKDEFWQYEEKHEIDVNKLKSVTANCEHDFILDIPKREAHCDKCGYGFRFQAHQVKEVDGKLVFSDKIQVPLD